MTVSLAQVSDALADRIRTVGGGLHVYPFALFTPPLPVAMVLVPPINYVEAMRRGVVTLEVDVDLFDGTSAGSEQQINLMPFLDWEGPRSIAAAIAADPSLGIVGSDGQPRVNAHVAASRPLGLEEMPDYAAIGHRLTLPVVVTNRE